MNSHLYSLSDRADLIDLQEKAVASLRLDSLLYPLLVRREEIIADQLDLRLRSKFSKRAPVVLSERIFE